MNNLRVKKPVPKPIIEIISRKQDYGYWVKLGVGDKTYEYKFESEEQWNMYYYANSYKAHPTSYSRTIKFTILKAIKQFKV